MSVREQIIGIITDEGYDTWTACEMADDLITRFKATGDKQRRYHVGGTAFTIRQEIA